MLETVREYAAERLADAGDRQAIRQAHAAHFTAVAAEIAARFLDGTGTLDRVSAEQDNLWAALAWASEHGEATVFVRLATDLHGAWIDLGRFAEAHDWLARALTVSETVPPPLRAAVVRAAGAFADALDRHARATARVVERFAAEWYDTHDWASGGAITRDESQCIVAYALTKLRRAMLDKADA